MVRDDDLLGDVKRKDTDRNYNERKRDKRRHHKSSRKRKHRDGRGRRKHDRSSEDDASSSVDSRSGDSDHRDRKRRRKEKKKRRDEEKKSEKKRRKEEKRTHREHRKRRDGEDQSSLDELQRNHAFADALHDLFQSYPGMASEVPVMLIRLAGGTSFDLSQMPDMHASTRLQQVLSTLAPFGVEKGDTGAWRWQAPTAGPQRANELLLVKIARTLLDQIGVTLEAAESFTNPQEKPQSNRPDLQSITHAMLEAFGKTTAAGSETPALAHEFGELCSVILAGENISLDGLADDKLRSAMEQIFSLAGLEKSEMEGDSDDGDVASQGEDPIMGFGLPDETGDNATSTSRTKMQSILDVCKTYATRTKNEHTKRQVRGPAASMAAREDIDDDDDDQGPAPVGSSTARRRVQQGPSLPPEVVEAMAAKRKKELEGVAGTGSGPALPSGETKEREEWMMEPGEHEFLQGIKSGAPLKNRSFQNTKQSGAAMQAAPVDPALQAEMDAIMRIHHEARGPTLIEQHRQKKAAEKAATHKGGKSEWQWSRDKDLDDGRRVDKNALSMVMGGAASGLKDKFQGGYSRG